MSKNFVADCKLIKSELAENVRSDSKFAIIVAAGSGQRAGGGLPKQFREVAGVPVLWHSVRAFRQEDPRTIIVLVLSESGFEIWMNLVIESPEIKAEIDKGGFILVRGGDSRSDSVRNALNAIEGTIDGKLHSLVAIHDAARPMATPDLIRRGWLEAGRSGAAIPVVPVTDSLRRVNLTTSESKSVNRSDYVIVQTPQVFQADVLFKAYKNRRPDKEYTDDASVVEEIMPIQTFEGDPLNIKVTRPYDFILAKELLARRSC